ncbi:MAG TPA: radical SAM protein [Candidatus Methylacidiphilales bacterium]
MSTLKDRLYDDVRLKTALIIEGVNFDPAIFRDLPLGTIYHEQVHVCFELDRHEHVGIPLPVGFLSPRGISLPLFWDKRSPYAIRLDGDSYILTDHGVDQFEIRFLRRPLYYRFKTSDGKPASRSVSYYREKVLFVAYSNECSLQDKGQDCLFCNINATKKMYGESEGIEWKYPKYIGEATAVAYKNGAKHITISGGFIPERRELEYYIDAAEAIQNATGLEDFNGTATIGAPPDLTVLDKYKEAGYRTVAMNIEVWNEDLFKYICPGKQQHCGGHKHWLKAYQHAVKLFGHGRVRSQIVSGLETKESTLEGIRTLADLGVICLASSFLPMLGSALEGHRTPHPEWHFDLSTKAVEIFRKNGFTYDQVYDATAVPNTVHHDIYKIEEELFPVFKLGEGDVPEYDEEGMLEPEPDRAVAASEGELVGAQA